MARQIHDLSRRRPNPFVAVNRAAQVETLVEVELFGIEERTATGVRRGRGRFEQARRGSPDDRLPIRALCPWIAGANLIPHRELGRFDTQLINPTPYSNG